MALSLTARGLFFVLTTQEHALMSHEVIFVVIVAVIAAGAICGTGWLLLRDERKSREDHDAWS